MIRLYGQQQNYGLEKEEPEETPFSFHHQDPVRKQKVVH
jgi:hypothetical protein